MRLTPRARGEVLPPLAGAPFAARNLFDIEGVTTLAGSKINRELAPATSDAVAVARLRAAGAILVGATNMDEYAFGFTRRIGRRRARHRAPGRRRETICA